MKQQYFVRLTVQVGYNYIKVLDELQRLNLIKELCCVRSTAIGNMVCVEFKTNTISEEVFTTLHEHVGSRISVLTYAITEDNT